MIVGPERPARFDLHAVEEGVGAVYVAAAPALSAAGSQPASRAMTARRSFRVWPVSTRLHPGEPEGCAGVVGEAGEELRDDLSSPLTVRLGARRAGLFEVDDHGVGTVESGFLDLFALASGNEENGA